MIANGRDRKRETGQVCERESDRRQVRERERQETGVCERATGHVCERERYERGSGIDLVWK